MRDSFPNDFNYFAKIMQCEKVCLLWRKTFIDGCAQSPFCC